MPADQMVHFRGETLETAIGLIAREDKSERHKEWIKRRLREAVIFVSDNPRSAKDYATYMALAKPVFLLAMQIDGRIDSEVVN